MPMLDSDFWFLLGVEIGRLTDAELNAVTDSLNSRGLNSYQKIIWDHVRGHLVLVDFPEKGRARFLRRHAAYLEHLRDTFTKPSLLARRTGKE